MVTCSSCGAQQSAAGACSSCGAQLSLVPGPTGDSAETRKKSGLSVVAFIFSLIPFFLWVIGLVLGIVSLVRISKSPDQFKGKGLAIASIVLSSFWLLMSGLLAAVAIPNFVKFQAKAKQSEARANLRALYVAERAFAMEGSDAKTPVTFQSIGFSPEPHRRYAYFFKGQSIQPDLGGPYRIPAQLAARVERPDVEAVAVGNVDSDPTLDVWLLDTNGQLTNVEDDASN